MPVLDAGLFAVIPFYTSDESPMSSKQVNFLETLLYGLDGEVNSYKIHWLCCRYLTTVENFLLGMHPKLSADMFVVYRVGLV